jgi:transposase
VKVFSAPQACDAPSEPDPSGHPQSLPAGHEWHRTPPTRQLPPSRSGLVQNEPPRKPPHAPAVRAPCQDGGSRLGRPGRDDRRAAGRGSVLRRRMGSPRGRDRGATPHLPSLGSRAIHEGISPGIYRARNLVERLVNRLKHFRRVATRYDRTARNYLAAVTLAAIHLGARFESTSWRQIGGLTLRTPVRTNPPTFADPAKHGQAATTQNSVHARALPLPLRCLKSCVEALKHHVVRGRHRNGACASWLAAAMAPSCGSLRLVVAMNARRRTAMPR